MDLRQYIETLSEEEKELFKDLIEACLQRDEEINASQSRAKEALANLDLKTEEVKERLKQGVIKLNDVVTDLSLQLKMQEFNRWADEQERNNES